MIEYE